MPLLIASLLPFSASAQTSAPKLLDLEFRPPEITPAPVCIPQESDIVTTAFWGEWDGKTLPDVDPALIKRDINRLQYIDARKWSETINLMITRLAESDPGYAGANALLARIRAMEAAGNFQGLRDEKLVEQLAGDIAGLPPRFKYDLSRFFRDGIGVQKDTDRANALLQEAGYAGDADALLTLSRMVLDGEDLEGWAVPPDMAVVMAFGALVGEMDATICDRTARIAREYHNGKIVRRDPQLAYDWFRFGADLGDANSAWKVAEYHIEAEGIEKDNAEMLHYLQQASDSGLTFAQIELGRLYEAGALVDKDLDTALDLYRAAATSGLRSGLTRLALFLQVHAEDYPELDDHRTKALLALAELGSPPGWVFTRLAEDVLDRRGRWAGQDQALGYLEKAAALKDMDGMTSLAEMLIARRGNPADFERGVSLLSYASATFGRVNPTTSLQSAFLCQAVDSPRVAEARYWQDIEAAIDNANLDIRPESLSLLNPQDDPLQVASLQSQALYGRANSLASYLKFLELSGTASADQLAFWKTYAGQYPGVLQALAKLEMQFAGTPQQQAAALDLLRREYRQTGTKAALALAEAIIKDETDAAARTAERTAELRGLLEPAAEAGEGAAIRLLAGLDDTDPSGRQTFEHYADVIDRDGDFEALVFAIPHLEGAKRDDYIARASGIVPCQYKGVITLADLSLSLGDETGARHWTQIAGHLVGDNAWSMVDLAKTQMALDGGKVSVRVEELLEASYALGNATAAGELFAMSLDSKAETYDLDRAEAMIVQAETTESPDTMRRFFVEFRRADKAVQAAFTERVDLPRLYLAAAKSGDVFAMRTYAMHLRENAADAADLRSSTEWLQQAADGGDTTAMAELGYALAFGIGIPPDPATAAIWLQRAADAGSRKAKAITSLLGLQDGI